MLRSNSERFTLLMLMQVHFNMFSLSPFTLFHVQINKQWVATCKAKKIMLKSIASFFTFMTYHQSAVSQLISCLMMRNYKHLQFQSILWRKWNKKWMRLTLIWQERKWVARQNEEVEMTKKGKFEKDWAVILRLDSNENVK